jgi:glycyl-tRNA synthetase beta subunit
MSEKDFLVEIGCAELPPKALKGLSDAFVSGLTAGLSAAGLSFKEIKAFTSPRRLAARVEGLVTAQADSIIERVGQQYQQLMIKQVFRRRRHLVLLARVGLSFRHWDTLKRMA